MNTISANLFPFIANTIILILAYDVACWAFTLMRHSIWMKRHPNRENAEHDRITAKMLGTAALLSGLHLILINLSWIYFKVYYGYSIILFIVIAGMDIMMIHVYALLARCTTLDKKWWPNVSAIIGDCFVSPCRYFIKKHSDNKNDVNGIDD